jgi:hypothetical protein
MNPLEIYLQDIGETHSTGANVKELSFYPALKDLLDAAGKELKPKVRSILSLKNQGGGMPDGGLFITSQLRKVSDDAILEQTPERGVIEVKSPSENVLEVTQSEQVTGYAQRYGLVLVTNLREFVLVKHVFGEKTQILEHYILASDETSFWNMTRRPRATAQEHGARLMEFLKRAMLTKSELTEPKDLAWFLASYARDAHACVDAAGNLPALATLRQAMQQALNMEFADEKGEHFFRSTLVQTLFYGVFSAWVLWHHENPEAGEKFDWHTATYLLKVPIIQSLFHQLSDPTKLRALGITNYLDLTGETLNRVNRAVFFAKFETGHAVQYFYEPFLEAYDPELRKELGVWYTPHEVVEYMVARVDTVLREELGLQDGLADPHVYVLDACCGTGAYPLAVLKRIAKTLQEKGEESLLGYELKRAATGHVFGFELLPAPFVISHLQIGLFLQQHGAPLGDDERASIYLTNALTGWEPPKGPKQDFLMPELEQERDAAEKVKRETPILVILGNPPYNAFAGVADTEEGKELVKPYKTGLRERWGIKKYNLDELYVRFMRLAEKQIVEQSGRGVICYISSFSYLSDPSFVVLRERLLNGFDKLWIDCLNGDSRETGKTTPEGLPDPSVFSTENNKEGIRVGTAIGLMVRKPKQTSEVSVHFRHFWGVNKRADLLDSLNAPAFNAAYQPAAPTKQNRYSFRPENVSAHYQEWPKVTELCAEQPFVGAEECRGGSLIDIQRDNLKKRMEAYFNSELDWDEYKSLDYGLTESAAGFDPKTARAKALKAEKFDNKRIVRFTLRPFETRWSYYTPVAFLWNRSRTSFGAQCWEGNRFLITRMNSQAKPAGVPMFISNGLIDKQTINRNPGVIPFRLKEVQKPKKSEDKHKKKQEEENLQQLGLIALQEKIVANLSNPARTYLAALGISNPDGNNELENGLKPYELVWVHALAIGYSPAYLRENKDGIQGDWPRIPLPASRATLIESAALGKQIAELLDTESQPSRRLNSPEFSQIAVLSRVDGKQIRPQQDDLALTAGWGHAQGNIVMPGQGKVVVNDTSLDVYLNDNVYWQNVPEAVWEYVIGGYQVIKKWLSYREKKILGRDITVEEAREVTSMAKRIAAILSMESQLDENYQQIKANTVKL